MNTETQITLPISTIHEIIKGLEFGIENTQEALNAHLNHYAPYCAVAKAERITATYKEQESQINAAIELLAPYKGDRHDAE